MRLMTGMYACLIRTDITPMTRVVSKRRPCRSQSVHDEPKARCGAQVLTVLPVCLKVSCSFDACAAACE